MGLLGDTVARAKEQLKARAVAEGRTPASEMYADQREQSRNNAMAADRAQAQADAEDERRRKAADAEAKRQQEHDAAQERKRQRHQEFQAERAQQKPATELKKKQTAFQKDQAGWNVRKKLEYADEEYQAEQKKILEKRKMPTAGQRVAGAVGTAAGDYIADIIYPAKPRKGAKQPKIKSTKGGRIVAPQRHSILDDFAPQAPPRRPRKHSHSGRPRTRRAPAPRPAPRERDPFAIDMDALF